MQLCELCASALKKITANLPLLQAGAQSSQSVCGKILVKEILKVMYWVVFGKLTSTGSLRQAQCDIRFHKCHLVQYYNLT